MSEETEDENLDQLELIRGPTESPSDEPDAPTSAQPFAADSDVVQFILISVGLIGILLIVLGIALQFAIAYETNPTSGESKLEFVEDAVLSVGIELLASGVMLWFFTYQLNKESNTKASRNPKKVLAAVALCGLMLIGIPVFCMPSYSSGIAVAFGVEVIGAFVIFTLLENVMKTIERKEQQNEL